MRTRAVGLIGAMLGSSATGSMGMEPASSARVQTEHAWMAALKVGASAKSCAASIGLVRARTLVRYCRYVSTATHPPCNSANSCELITDHIAMMTAGWPKSATLPGVDENTDWRGIIKLHAN